MSDTSDDNNTKLFYELFDSMPFNVYVADTRTYELVFINHNLKQTINNTTSRKCHQAIYKVEHPCEHCTIHQLQDNEGRPKDMTIVSELFNDIDDKWYQLQDRCIAWSNDRVVKYSIAVDITGQKQVQNQLAEAHAQLALRSKTLETKSVTDPLTGLYNRYKVKEVLDIEISRCSRKKSSLSVILMDLDEFKQVNDLYGHLAGDQVLQKSAGIIKQVLRAYDHCARWGGEEFLIICPQTNIIEAKSVAEKLRSQLADTCFSNVGRVTGSFGISEYQNQESIDQFIERADKGLYLSKERGRNQVSVFGE